MIIYMVRNKINNKVYFGQTRRSFNARYKYNFPQYTHNKHIRNSIEKYGWENFEVIEEFDRAETQEELNKLENLYIKMWQTYKPKHGYNKTLGGETCVFTDETVEKLRNIRKGKFLGEENPFYGRSHTEETKRILSEKMKGRFVGEKSPCYGKKMSEEFKERLRQANLGRKASEETKKKMSEMRKGLSNSNCRKVAQYTLEGEFVKVWGYIKLASAELNIEAVDITKCCRGTCKSAGGYQWRYVDEDGNYEQRIDKHFDKRDNQGIKIHQYTKQGELVKTWNSIKEASTELRISAGGICSCCKGKLKTHKGFIWKYAE